MKRLKRRKRKLRVAYNTKKATGMIGTPSKTA
jgi:hypothetical protein